MIYKLYHCFVAKAEPAYAKAIEKIGFFVFLPKTYLCCSLENRHARVVCVCLGLQNLSYQRLASVVIDALPPKLRHQAMPPRFLMAGWQ